MNPRRRRRLRRQRADRRPLASYEYRLCYSGGVNLWPTGHRPMIPSDHIPDVPLGKLEWTAMLGLIPKEEP